LRKWDVEEVEVNKGESKEGIFEMHFAGVVVYEFYKLGFNYLRDFPFSLFWFFYNKLFVTQNSLFFFDHF
jgi:hypothetical protein